MTINHTTDADVVFVEKNDLVAWLEKITQEYAAITDEEGLSIDEIYAQREQSRERTFEFD